MYNFSIRRWKRSAIFLVFRFSLRWIRHFYIFGNFARSLFESATKNPLSFRLRKITTPAYRISPSKIKQPVNPFFLLLLLLLPSHRSPPLSKNLGRTISRRVESRISGGTNAVPQGVAPLRGSDSRQRIKRWKFVYKRGANPEFSPPVLKEIPPRFKAGNCRPRSPTIYIYIYTQTHTHTHTCILDNGPFN